LDYPRTFTINNGGARPAAWQPWTTDTTWHGDSHPEPILSDITFDENGDMTLAFIDRYGMITGNNNYPPQCSDTSIFEGHAGGEILKACATGTSWTLESNGVCGANTTGGAGTGEGPGGGEFYTGDNAGISDDGLYIYHQETGSGSLVQLLGSGQVMTTVFDPKTYDSGGVSLMPIQPIATVSIASVISMRATTPYVLPNLQAMSQAAYKTVQTITIPRTTPISRQQQATNTPPVSLR